MDLISAIFMPMASILSFGIIIFFILAIIQEGKRREEGKSVLKEAFFYIVAFLMIGFVVGSGVIMLQLGLKSWVFTKAETQAPYPPSGLMLNVGNGKEPVTVTGSLYSCGEKCDFSAADRQNLTDWKTGYESWKNSVKDTSQRRQQQAATAISFLIVSLPLYLIFFRKVQKEHRSEQEDKPKRNLIRQVYFYIISLVGLLLIVVPLALIINIGLTTWVFPKADIASENDSAKPASIGYTSSSEKSGVQSIINCASKCNFTDEEVALTKEWLSDYDQAIKPKSNVATKHNRLAIEIAFLAFGLPLFAYHFSEIRKERKGKKEQDVSSNQT